MNPTETYDLGEDEQWQESDVDQTPHVITVRCESCGDTEQKTVLGEDLYMFDKQADGTYFPPERDCAKCMIGEGK